MQTTTVDIPHTSNFKTAARWVAEDLLARNAQRFTWDERVTYKLPHGGSVKVTTLTRSGLAIMPATLDTSGVCVMKTELADDTDSAARRIRLSLMRAHRRNKPAARR